MDAFFVAVEVRHDPSLAGKPVIVGGSGDRGVVASCSYEARAYGIHSAMPSTRARRLCPQAIFVHGHYDSYSEYSARIHEIFHAFTPVVEGIALDEAFLDVSGARRLFGTGPEIAWAIRRRLAEELGLSASVGVATSKLIAKLASEAAKPTASLKGPQPGLGVKLVPPGEELAFLHPLPVRALWGVGPATGERLRRFGVVTVGDLADVPVDALVGALGSAAGRHLHALSWARDERPVVAESRTKSVGHEETYAHDVDERDHLHREVVRMADAVGSRLRKAGLTGRTVTLKVRYHDFATITRSHTVATSIDTGPDIARVAAGLLDAVELGAGVRLLGVSLSNLIEGQEAQLSFDDLAGGAPPGGVHATRAVDAVRERFGEASVGPAALVDGGGLRVKRRGEQQWGPGGDDGG
ncbi:MAG: polymerase [Acidimicrobiaceae bacterium]|nr:polymerase [Acidimicrobiaceae bacterium]